MAGLIAKAEAIGVVDAYQYINTSQRQAALPHNLRITIRHRRARELGSAIHDQFVLAVALRTPGRVLLDKRPVRLRAGELLLIMPGQFHGYEDEVDEDVYWFFATFHHAQGESLEPLRSTPLAIDRAIAGDLGALLEQQFHHAEQGKRHTPGSERRAALRLSLVLEQMLERRLQDLSEVDGNDGTELTIDTSHPLIRKIIAYVTAHLEQPITIADIGAALHLSPGHLRNEFHRYVGFGLGHYVRYLKMAHACRLMDTTELSLAEIGERCGYSSIYSFSRAFKTEKGISPSAYRKAYRAVR